MPTAPLAFPLTERVRALPNSVYLVTTADGPVLVNCPPETLKFLLAERLPIPKIILLPPDMPAGSELGSSGFVRRGISYASAEFLLYYNFFVGGGQRTQLVTVTEHQAHRLHQILEETIDGPAEPAQYGPYAWLQHECAAVSYFPALGHAPGIADLVEISSLERSTALGSRTRVRLAEDRFIFTEDGREIAAVPTAIIETPLPLSLAPPFPVLRHEITLQFIGGSDGFDPAGITTCFLAYIGATGHSEATLFDVAAYLRVRLGNLGASPAQISEVVLSHLHEDHMAGLPELLLMGERRVRLLTSSLIHASLLRVLSAMLDVTEAQAGSLFDFYPLNPGAPVNLEGRRFECIYAVHSIPTLAVRVNSLCYSGDMRYDENWFVELENNGVLSAARRMELTQFAQGTSVLVQDAGGGAIHTTLTPEIVATLTNKSQRVIFAHTSQASRLEKQTPHSNIEFARSGHISGIGASIPRAADADRVETLSACPLFARLPVAERSTLADQVEVLQWEPDQVIVQEGETPDGRTYVVHSGLVEVWSGEQLLRVLGRGNSIGERGALQGEMRTVTLKARGPVALLMLPQALFAPIAEQLGLREAFSRADWLWGHPTFGHLPWATLLDLALDFQPRTITTGDILFQYGDPGYECYLLITGEVGILDKDGEALGEFTRPGEFFGGRAALFGTPRNATAQVTSNGEVWALPAPALHRLQSVYPNVLLHLRVVEANRRGERPLISTL